MRAAFNIRQLTAADVTAVRALNVLFSEAFEDAAADGAEVPSDHLRKLLARPHLIVLVAVVDEAVVGGLVAYELEKLESMRSELYIYDLAVAESHRRRGIATALIERLHAVAAERGSSIVYVQADWGDEPARALYGKLGSRKRVLHFELHRSIPR